MEYFPDSDSLEWPLAGTAASVRRVVWRRAAVSASPDRHLLAGDEEMSFLSFAWNADGDVVNGAPRGCERAASTSLWSLRREMCIGRSCKFIETSGICWLQLCVRQGRSDYHRRRYSEKHECV